MERPKRTCSSTRSTSTVSKKQRNESTNSKTLITTLEDLSDDLFYSIFDYMDYILIFATFSPLNERFSTIVKNYPSPKILDGTISDDSFASICHFVINPQKQRIRSITLPLLRHINIFFSMCDMDGTFLRLESITLKYILPRALLSTLSPLQTLPSLNRLSLEIEVMYNVNADTFDMTPVYQMLLSFKSLKYLKSKTSDHISDDMFCIKIPSNSNHRPSNLEYLVVDHLIFNDHLFSILLHTPKLRHLFLGSLEARYGSFDTASYPSPKLPHLTKLIVARSTITVEDLEMLLDDFGCRLQTLKISTYSYSSFETDEQWERLMTTTLSDLSICKIGFDKRKWYEMDDEDDDGKKHRIQSSINFVFDSFWYDHNWKGQISVHANSVEALFHRSKICHAVDNHQPESQLQKLIHFSNQYHQLNCPLSASYRLTIDGHCSLLVDYRENIGKECFLNSTANISYLPIKQLTIICSNISILDLIKTVKKLPRLTCLSIRSESISEVVDQVNENINSECRFDNVEELEIHAFVPWEIVTCLIKYFPKMINLYVYCRCSAQTFDDIRGSFPFNDLAGVQYHRRFKLIQEEKEKEATERRAWAESPGERMLDLIREMYKDHPERFDESQFRTLTQKYFK